MASFLSSTNGGLAARALSDTSADVERQTAADGFILARLDRGVRQGASLAKMVESEIIPRLMIAHRALQAAPAPTDRRRSLGDETTEMFARMVVSSQPDSLLEFVGGLLQGGVSIESILVDLLAPAARRLGEYWDEDIIPFADVTIGLGRLQQVVRALGCSAPNGDARRSPSVLFAPAPGEQHTFGLFLVEDTFRRSGWRTWLETSRRRQDLIDTAHANWFDVFGLGASREAKAADIAELISIVRFSSCNRDLLVLVGGRLFIEHPELVAEVGADATAAAGDSALLIANEALSSEENGVRRVASGL